MINNNPYNVPEKPLKQSKITIEPVPLLPHQINRRSEEMHPQMLKRSTLPYFIETPLKEVPRIPLSPQTVLKGQHLQVSTVAPWENGRESPSSNHFRELSERISVISERLDSQERRLAAITEVRKHEQSTTLSDSTAHSYQPNLFISKQMEKYSQFEASCHNSTQMVEKLREEVMGVKFEREKYELAFKEQLAIEMDQQKNAITAHLITSFRESLNEKFAYQEQKINNCIQEMTKIENAKIENAMFEIKKDIANQIFFLREEFKSQQNRDKSSNLGLQLKERSDRLNAAICELRGEYLSFKDHVFKSILATHHQEEELSKVKQKIQLISAHLEKRQISPYEGHLNVSSEKTHHEMVRVSLESYLSAVGKHESMKGKVGEWVYYVDSEGFLLDAHGYYILNSKNCKIKIEEGEMRRLKDMGILQ